VEAIEVFDFERSKIVRRDIASAEPLLGGDE
jgi:hypothetical protein